METCNFTGSSVPSFWLVSFSSLQDHQFPLFFIFLIFHLLILSSNVTIIVAMATEPKLYKPNVLFPDQSFHLRHPADHYDHPPNAGRVLDRCQVGLLQGMLLADARLPRAGGDRDLSPGGDGLRPLRGHLPSLALDQAEEPRAGCGSLVLRAAGPHPTGCPVISADLWRDAQGQPLLLRPLGGGPGRLPKCLHHVPEFPGVYHFYEPSPSVRCGLWSSPTPASWSPSCRSSPRKNRRRTFSTCFSHLVVVIMYCSSIAPAFLSYRVKMPSDIHILSDRTFAILTPLVNPFISTLRNRDIKRAVGQLPSSKVFSMQKARLRLDQVRSKEI